MFKVSFIYFALAYIFAMLNIAAANGGSFVLVAYISAVFVPAFVWFAYKAWLTDRRSKTRQP